MPVYLLSLANHTLFCSDQWVLMDGSSFQGSSELASLVEILISSKIGLPLIWQDHKPIPRVIYLTILLFICAAPDRLGGPSASVRRFGRYGSLQKSSCSSVELEDRLGQLRYSMGLDRHATLCCMLISNLSLTCIRYFWYILPYIQTFALYNCFCTLFL